MHKPVLLDEAVEGLAIKPNGIYIDCTFGRGGHSQAILDKLNEFGRLIAIDKDMTAIEAAKVNFKSDTRFEIVHSSYKNLTKIANDLGVNGQVNGILMDLGVSSPQLDDNERGFSFMQQGPLDMRMDITESLDAKAFINNAEADEMAWVFKEYGEERYAKRIAGAICVERDLNPITSTLQLAEIVKRANPNWEKHKHPATRVFQAIRIHVNNELNELKDALIQSLNVLAVGGRLAVISFHSLEDRIVKQFMQKQEKGELIPLEIPIKSIDIETKFRRIGKAIKPLKAEVQQNTRARSAILRIGEKLI